MRNLKKTLSLFALSAACLFCPLLYAQTDSVKEYYEKGFQLISEQKLDEALESFKKAAELAPDLPQIYYAMGLIHFEKKENVYDAIDAFEKAVSLKPDMPEPHYHLGIIYSSLVPEEERAEKHFLDSIQASPQYSPPYFGLGLLKLTKQRDPKSAAEYLEKAAALNPEHVDALYYLGLSYIMNGESHRALKAISLLKMQGNENMSRALEEMMEVDASVVKQRVLGGEEGESGPQNPEGAVPAPQEVQPAAEEKKTQVPEFLFS